MADQEQSASLSDQLQQRLDRLYRLVGAAREKDLGKFPARVIATEERIGIEQDFCGGMTEDQIADAIYLMLDAIVHLKDHVKNRLVEKGDDPKAMLNAAKRCDDLRICRMLVNQAKHGIPTDCDPSDALSLSEVSRPLRMTVGGKHGKTSVMRLVNRDGVPGADVRGGHAEVIFSTKVVDGNDKALGNVHDIALRAVNFWYSQLQDLGFELPAEYE